MRFPKKNAILRTLKIELKKINDMLLFLAVKMAGLFLYTFFHLDRPTLHSIVRIVHTPYCVSVSTDG